MEKNYVPKQLFKLVSNSAPEEVEKTIDSIRNTYGKEAEALARLFNSDDATLIAQLSSGVSRPVDELGRVVIPRELRRDLDFENGSILSFTAINDCLVIKKVIPSCTICGSIDCLEDIKGKKICARCKSSIIRSNGNLVQKS